MAYNIYTSKAHRRQELYRKAFATLTTPSPPTPSTSATALASLLSGPSAACISPEILKAALDSLAMCQKNYALQAQVANKVAINKAIQHHVESSGFHFFTINGSPAAGLGLFVILAILVLIFILYLCFRCKKGLVKHLSIRNATRTVLENTAAQTTGPTSPIVIASPPLSLGNVSAPPATGLDNLLRIAAGGSSLGGFPHHLGTASAPALTMVPSAPSVELMPLQNAQVFGGQQCATASAIPYGV